MKDAEKDIAAMQDEEEYEYVIVFTDDNGKEHAFYEEQQFVAGKNTYAILVGLPEDACACGEEDCHCHEHENEEETAIIAKIKFDKDGSPVYVEPSEKEFAEARAAYDALAEDAE